jgi:hypothetical protein
MTLADIGNMLLPILLLFLIIITFNKKILWNKKNKWIIIVCLIFYYCWLSVNPFNIWSISKITLLNKIPKKNKPTTFLYNHNVDLNYLKYPVIFKPNICSGIGRNVEIIKSKKEAINYIKDFRKIHKNEVIIIQNFIKSKHEFGILYERLPWNKNGKIIAITEKIYDKKNKIKIWNENAFGEEYGYYIDCPYLINKKIEQDFDKITKNISKNMYVCRYDVLINNRQDLYNEKFKILEVNGAMGYDLRVWDNIKDIKRYAFLILRWLYVRLLIGIYNVLTFNGVNILQLILNFGDKITLSMGECKDWEHFFEWGENS